MDQLFRDLRCAVRNLRRTPGPTLAALLVLGLGVGATGAVYTVVDAVLLEPLPYPEPDGLVMLVDSNPQAGFPRFSTAPPDFADWRREATSFDGMAAFTRADLVLDEPESEPQRVQGARVTHGFFEVLGLEPERGRTFRPEEDRPGAEKVALLGHGVWSRRFGADPGVVGRVVTVDGESRRVVGVMPRGFAFPRDAELWLPLALEISPDQRGAHWLTVLARLRQGRTFEEAQAEMTGITARLARTHPETNEGWTVRLFRLHELVVEDVRPALRVLMAAVVAVLLIVCANVANLLLVRTARRERELALRGALGASRGRLVQQLLTETLVLSLAGGALGLLLGAGGTRALVALNADGIPRSEGIGLDGSVVLVVLAAGLLTGLLAGLVPVVHASRGDLLGALKEGSAGSGEGRRAKQVRRVLVLFETATAVVLLVAAGLLVRSLVRVQGTSPGFEPEGALTAQVSLPGASYPDEPSRARFYDRVLEELGAVPGVEVAGAGFPLPLSGGAYFLNFAVEGRPPPPPQEAPAAGIRFVTPGYVEALGVPLLAGRTVTAADEEGARPVALVNRTLAERVWPDGEALGSQITVDDPTADDAEWRTVVGIVGDVRHGDVTAAPDMEIYLPMAQSPMPSAALVLRTIGDPASLGHAFGAAVRAVDPGLPTYRARTLEAVVSSSLSERRLGAALLGVFAALALVLASVGLYGVVSYGVTQRRRELGLRMALGAPQRRVQRLVLQEGMGLVLAGVGLGLSGALAATRALQGFLYEVRAADPLTFTAVPALLAAVGLLATWIPARRAVRVDPVVALRSE